MAVSKTERLVNLTMALLATRRFMPKSEIFRKVAGYDAPDASQEAKERMFERDKDDLRSLGIEIDVASQDPLFEDEPGYRIRSERYRMPAKSFSESELAMLATALSVYSSESLGRHSRNLMQRIRTLEDVVPEMEIELSSTFAQDESLLLDIAAALSARQAIAFRYKKLGQLEPQSRTVNPMGLCAWQDAWYLVGEDTELGEIRVFKLERFATAIERIGEVESFEIPADFAVRDYVVMFHGDSNPTVTASLKVRRGRALQLRSLARSTISVDDEWDQIEVGFENENQARSQILWFGSDVEILAPSTLRAAVIEKLTELVKNHG